MEEGIKHQAPILSTPSHFSSTSSCSRYSQLHRTNDRRRVMSEITRSIWAVVLIATGEGKKHR